jgi:transcriptional regulator with XRE-family HTH domain
MMQQQNVDVSKIFSERLQELRGTRKKAEFARFLGIPKPQTYQNYEAGRVPETEMLINIADKCGCTVDWLLGRDAPHFLREQPGEYRVTRAGQTVRYSFLVAWSTEDLQNNLEIARAAEDWGLVAEIAGLLQERKKNGRPKPEESP